MLQVAAWGGSFLLGGSEMEPELRCSFCGRRWVCACLRDEVDDTVIDMSVSDRPVGRSDTIAHLASAGDNEAEIGSVDASVGEPDAESRALSR